MILETILNSLKISVYSTSEYNLGLLLWGFPPSPSVYGPSDKNDSSSGSTTLHAYNDVILYEKISK